MADIFDEIERLEQEHRFVEALRRLRGALLEATGAERMRLDIRRKEIEKAQEQRAQGIVAGVEGELQKGAPDLAAVEKQLGLLQEQVWPDHPALKRLREDIEKRRAAVARKRELDDLEAELEANKDVPWHLTHDRLHVKAQGLAARYPDEERVQELLKRAQKAREQAYQREEKLTTAAAVGQWQQLVGAMEEDRRRGVAELPWYVVTFVDDTGKHVRKPDAKEFRPAQEAYEHLLTLAQQGAEGKADEKIEEVKGVLEANPEAAVTTLEKVLAKDGKEDYEGLYRHLGDPKRRQVEQVLAQAQEAWARRQRVEAALRQVRKEEPEAPRQAWERVEELAQEDAAAPSLRETRDNVRARLEARLWVELAELEDRRRDGKTGEARGEAQGIRQWAQRATLTGVAQEADALIEQCAQDEQVAGECQRIAGLVAKGELDAARSALDALFAQPYVRERKTEFTRLAELENLWQARHDLERFIQGAAKTLRSQDDGELESMEKACAAELARRGAEERLQRLLERVQAHLAFLAAQKAYARQDYETAREKCQKVIDLKGDDAREAQQLKREAEAGDDEKKEVTRAIEQAEQALKSRFKHYYPAEQAYQSALAALDKHRYTRDERWLQVNNLIREVEGRWGKAVDAELARLWGQPQDERPMAEIERLILRILDERLRLRDRAEHWKKQALPVVYRVRAEAAARSYAWEKALSFVNQALEIQADAELTGLRQKYYKNSVYQKVEWIAGPDTIEGLKKVIEEKLPDDGETLSWLEQSWNRWGNLEQVRTHLIIRMLTPLIIEEGPPDIETRVRLAELGLKLGNLTQARGYLDAARRHLEHNEELRREWGQRVERMARQIAADQDVRNTQQDIVSYLGLPAEVRQLDQAADLQLTDRDARQLKAACEAYKELTQREAERRAGLAGEEEAALLRRDLDRWNDKQLVQVLKVLTGSLGQYQTEEVTRAVRDPESFLAVGLPIDAIKDRWVLALKIGVLNPDSITARPILDEVVSLWSAVRIRADTESQDNVGPRTDAAGESLSADQAFGEQIGTLRRIINRVEEIQRHFQWVEYVGGRSQAIAQSSPVESEVRPTLTALKNHLAQLADLHRRIGTVQTFLSNARKPVRQDIVKSWREHLERMAASPDDGDCREALSQISSAIEGWLGKAGEVTCSPVWGEEVRVEKGQVRYDELWKGVDEALADLPSTFNRHRTVEWVRAEVQKAKEEHRDMLRLAGKLILSVRLEDFAQALDALDALEEILRQKDTFGIWAELSLTDPYPEPAMCRPGELRARLDSKRGQLEAVDAWIRNVEPIVDWSEASKSIIQRADRAEYHGALALCQDVLQGLGEAGRTNELAPAVSLTRAVAVLREKPPQATSPLLSRRVQARLAEAERLLRTAEAASEKAQQWANIPDDATVEWLVEARYPREWAERLPREAGEGIGGEWREWSRFVSAVEGAIEHDIPRASARSWLPWRESPKEGLRRHWRGEVERARQDSAKEWPGWNELLGRIDAA